MELQILAILLLCASSLADLCAEYENKDTLNGDNYKLYWTHNATSNMMHIALEVKATGWVALAFAKEKTKMKNYDTCLGYVSGADKVMKDFLTDGYKAPPEDSQNDCMLDHAEQNGGTTILKYHRKVDTSDSNDVVIEKGEIYVMWAYKYTDVSLTHHDTKGYKTLTMISSGEAARLKSFYWKTTVASLSVAVALFFK